MKAAISTMDYYVIIPLEDERDLDLPKRKLMTDYI